MRVHIAMGLTAIVIWLALFTAGATIDSGPYRDILAPTRADHALAASAVGAVEAAAIPASSGSPPAAAKPAPASTGPADASQAGKVEAFLGVMALYTPLNVALLTIFAGLVGGCASSITYARSRQAAAAAGKEQGQPGPSVFLTEHPIASMLRSFLVYLAFIAGAFITTNDPFKSPTPDQYVRLAGLLSFVAFVIGYDPTRIQDILSLNVRGETKD